MRVDLTDGRCRSYGGTLMFVVANCTDSYPVEPDAFGDGCMTYCVAFRMRQTEHES